MTSSLKVLPHVTAQDHILLTISSLKLLPLGTNSGKACRLLLAILYKVIAIFASKDDILTCDGGSERCASEPLNGALCFNINIYACVLLVAVLFINDSLTPSRLLLCFRCSFNSCR